MNRELSIDSISRLGGRETLEDRVETAISSDCACLMLADGLGGHHGGEIAARAACEAFLTEFKSNPGFELENLRGYVQAAHNAVRTCNREGQGGGPGMSTTFIAA